MSTFICFITFVGEMIKMLFMQGFCMLRYQIGCELMLHCNLNVGPHIHIPSRRCPICSIFLSFWGVVLSVGFHRFMQDHINCIVVIVVC